MGQNDSKQSQEEEEKEKEEKEEKRGKTVKTVIAIYSVFVELGFFPFVYVCVSFDECLFESQV